MQSDSNDADWEIPLHLPPAGPGPDLEDDRLRRRWDAEARLIEIDLVDERVARTHRTILIVLALLFMVITGTAFAFIFATL